MKKLLGIVAVGAIAFGAVTSAATTLGLGSVVAPAQDVISITGLGCTASGPVTLAYGTDSATVTGLSQAMTCTTDPGSFVVSDGSDLFASLGANFTDTDADSAKDTLTVSFTAVSSEDFGTSDYDSITVTAKP